MQRVPQGQNIFHQIVRGIGCASSPHSLARVPAGWNHPAEKDSRQINKLEQILIGEVMQLRRDLL